MGNTFMSSPSYLWTSESVTEGHPDKVCDQISDAVLDAVIGQGSQVRVACETAATFGVVNVMGEITAKEVPDYERIARDTLRRIGYASDDVGLSADTCRVHVLVHGQSPEIAASVQAAWEVRTAAKRGQADPLDQMGAGDQGMMLGFACDETEQWWPGVHMPLPIFLSHRLCQRLTELRNKRVVPYLRPDGKSQVTVEYRYGVPVRVAAVILAAQHDPSVNREKLQKELNELVVRHVIPQELLDDRTEVRINTSGSFIMGGPAADTGLTGRKILVDTYGSMARHGGGAFSGKDPTKVDRSGAYAARHMAKNVVAAGLAKRCEVQVAYAIGVARPLNVSVETFGTNAIPDEKIVALLNRHFDMRPAAIIRDLELWQPIYRQTAAYGHFGRPGLNLPWERDSKAKALATEAGIAPPTAHR